MMDALVYVNVDTQTSFSTTTDEDTADYREDSPLREPFTNQSRTQLETIEERLHGDDENDEDGEAIGLQQQQQPHTNEPLCDTHQATTIDQDQVERQRTVDMNQLEDQQRQLIVLRDLLRVERQKNHQRKLNNSAMQQYLTQLQSEYLKLQRELVETLELSHKIKAQKEAQIKALDETLVEKNKLIEQLKENLTNLDESKLRLEFKELMEKQNKLAELEKEQLRQQIDSTEQQLMRERVNNSQILQQFQSRLDEQLKAHEEESANMKRKLSAMENDYEKLLNEPQNLIIKNLKEEKSRLSCQLDELSLVLNESQSKYETLQKRIEGLLSEQEQIESTNQTEIERLQQYCAEQRRAYNEIKLQLDDRDEVVQIVQFNLQRSEKRVKNLLHAFKGKEETYKELINQLHDKHEQESSELKAELRSVECKLVDCQSELEKKQNEIMKLELERDNQLESIRNDRDERIIKLNQDKLKLERELKMTELKLAREFEDKENKSKQIEQYQRELHYFRGESKRLSIELTKVEAKLFSQQKEIKDLNESNKELSFDDVQRFEEVKLELEEAQRHSKRLDDTIMELQSENKKLRMKLKVNESNLAKINSSITKEHAKMLHEYETRMERIKSEQSIFDKNKIKYKRCLYGR